ncbi:1,4-alpha-glucan-branching enzyme 3, chloroplastic/amyloplastic [Vitis vinifera]|uniref:1,4-alpha-glucan-branching enzyme 3, chloroplastic/amyloplastic n=1 Tax=Vitis vinifera TaxID=29760 RepID=A0A438H6J3_VITVI|nr:1,4-alpha-glucan-branching enzyme 3, chloroplastic/amyloplastic [Vitis vinifera]
MIYILNTDETKYGGQGLIEEGQYLRRNINRRVDGLRNCLEVPLPSRTAQGVIGEPHTFHRS